MLLDDLRDYLIASGASSILWPCYEGFMPDATDQAIGVFESGGYPRDTLDGGTQTVTFQLRIRASKLDYAVGRAKWEECFNLLQDSQQTAGSPILLPGVVFIQTMATGPLVFTDALGRPNFTANFRVLRYT